MLRTALREGDASSLKKCVVGVCATHLKLSLVLATGALLLPVHVLGQVVKVHRLHAAPAHDLAVGFWVLFLAELLESCRW